MEIQTKWDLARYFYSGLDDPRLRADLDAIVPSVRAFVERFTGRIRTADVATIAEYYDESGKLHDRLRNVDLYLFFRSSLDTQDTETMRVMGRLEVANIEAEKLGLALEQEWKELGSEKLREYARDPRLTAHRNALESKADTLRYLLDETSERVLATKSRALGTVDSLHDELVGSFTFPIELDGVTKELTDDEVRALRTSPDRETRRRAAESIRNVYGSKQNRIVLGRLYTGVVKDWVSDVELRGYAGVMDPRNVSEELDRETVDTLLAETAAHAHLCERYYRIKRRYLGLDELRPYDTLASVAKSERKFSFEEAVALHMETMRAFDAEFADYSEALLAEGRVDVMPASGKRGGAFACYVKNAPSFVLLNHTDDIRDVSTLSHEFGHAIHGHLSQAQAHTGYDSPLSLAETASIFSESLLADKLVTILDEKDRASLLDTRIQDVMSTIFTQIQYVSFERRAHEAIAAGEELTWKELNVMWREERLKILGDSVAYDTPAEEEIGWSTIPHIFNSPFYCYAYAFGNILVFSLLDRYRREGAAFVPAYKKILKSGGSKRPRELLAEHGIDIADPEFYRAAFRQIEAMLDTYESLAPRA